MYTQSIIQQKINIIESKYQFETQVKNILEKYEVKNNVITFRNGQVCEMSSGYMCPVKEYEDIQEAIREMNMGTQVLRIVENKKFIVGDFFTNLCDCVDREDVFNIEHLENVY